MSADPRVGQTLDGRYVLRRRIGAGGMGVVYEAEHTALERRVAIKLIDTAAAPAGFVERFRREARLAARIAHEHLVEIYDVGSAAGTEYIVMELVEGRDLRQELVTGALSYARAKSIARQLLSALAAIHDAGIVHRDIKPANVMLTTRGDDRDYVKLMDFGVARSADDERLTKTGYVMGTPSFMAPEQVRGKAVDHRSDLYAVGVTLFAMLAGRLPFDGNTAAVAGAHVFQAPPSLVSVRPGMPAGLAAVVDRALAKSPDDRYPDARAFAAALADEPAPAIAVAPPARARARGAAIAGLAAATVLGGVAGFVVRGMSARDAAAPPTTVATPAAPPARPPLPEAPATPPSTPAPSAAEPATPQPVTPAPTSVQPAPAATPATPAAPAKPPGPKPPGPKPTAPSGPPQYCQCVPTNAPDLYGLCPKPGRPLCRCDAVGGRSLCPAPLRHHESCESYEGKKTCRVVEQLECPDPDFADFHAPGAQGDPCSGYFYQQFQMGLDTSLHQGKLDCDACPGIQLDSFRGRPGDACTGYYWRTGEQKAGTLAHCGERY